MADAVLTRRAMLRAIPIVTSTMTMPAAAAIKPAEGSLVVLLRQWRDAYDASYDEDGECGPLREHQYALIDRAIETPAVTAEDFAAKLLILTVYGDHDLADNVLEVMIDDAEQLLGIPAPSRMAAWRAEHRA